MPARAGSRGARVRSKGGTSQVIVVSRCPGESTRVNPCLHTMGLSVCPSGTAGLSAQATGLSRPHEERECAPPLISISSSARAAEMIRETVGRFADEQIAPLADRVDREDWFPRDELWTAMGALGPARHHGRGRMGRAGPGLSRTCDRGRGSQPRERQHRPVLRRAFEPLRQPDPPLGQRRAEGEISAQADLRRTCRQPRDERGQRGLGRRLDEAQGRSGPGRIRPQRHQVLDHQRDRMPIRWWSMPRPMARRAAGASPPS